MLPKKNIGAITVMTAFLGLAATRLCTALIYYSYRDDPDIERISSLFGAVGIFELLLLIALAVGFGMMFIYSDDLYTTGLLGASVMLAVLSISSKFSIVNSEPTVMTGVSLAMNLCLLLLFGLYALYFYRKDLKAMAVTAGAAGLWIAVCSIIIRSAVSSSASGNSFGIYAVISLMSALCYGIAYYSQRQSFE